MVRVGAAIAMVAAALSVHSREASASSSVVGLWHLNEKSGTTAFDRSGKGNNGVISGPVTVGVAGHLNTAYRFVPKGSIIVQNASDLVPGRAKIKISYWLKATTLPCCHRTDYDIFTKGTARAEAARSRSRSSRTARHRACSAARAAASSWSADRTWSTGVGTT